MKSVQYSDIRQVELVKKYWKRKVMLQLIDTIISSSVWLYQTFLIEYIEVCVCDLTKSDINFVARCEET